MENYEKEIDEAANSVVRKLGLSELTKSVKELKERIDKAEGKKFPVSISKILDLENMAERRDSLTVNEKIIGFFAAAMKGDKITLKALSEGTSADGGYLVPDEFRAEVVRDLAEGNFMRNEVQVIPMKRDTLKAPSLESRPKVTWTDENDTKSTTTASFDEITLSAKKMAAIMYCSDELVEDSTEVDIVRFIIGLFSEAVGTEEDRVIWRGNGTTQPTGIVTSRASGNITTRTATAGLNFDEVINLIYDLPGKYHKNAKLYAHRYNIRDMRKLKDSQNRYYWQEPVAVGQPATFYGYPVIEVNDLPDSEIYFGNLKKGYWLGDKGQMAVKTSQDTETAFTKDQTAIRVVERIAGNVVLPNAIRCLNGI